MAHAKHAQASISTQRNDEKLQHVNDQSADRSGLLAAPIRCARIFQAIFPIFLILCPLILALIAVMARIEGPCKFFRFFAYFLSNKSCSAIFHLLLEHDVVRSYSFASADNGVADASKEAQATSAKGKLFEVRVLIPVVYQISKKRVFMAQ